MEILLSIIGGALAGGFVTYFYGLRKMRKEAEHKDFQKQLDDFRGILGVLPYVEEGITRDWEFTNETSGETQARRADLQKQMYDATAYVRGNEEDYKVSMALSYLGIILSPIETTAEFISYKVASGFIGQIRTMLIEKTKDLEKKLFK